MHRGNADINTLTTISKCGFVLKLNLFWHGQRFLLGLLVGRRQMGISGRVLAWRFVCMGSSGIRGQQVGAEWVCYICGLGWVRTDFVDLAQRLTRHGAPRVDASLRPQEEGDTTARRRRHHPSRARSSSEGHGSRYSFFSRNHTGNNQGCANRSRSRNHTGIRSLREVKPRRELGNFEKLKWILKEEEFEEAQIALKGTQIMSCVELLS
nr:uncharacterized protein LOC117847213 isoform X1 [Setaria viridis]